MEGKVKWFSDNKGYGYLSGDDQSDYFAHYSYILCSGYKKLEAGQRVSFDVESSDKGLKAINISVLEGRTAII